jgi:hypothetical protein
MKYLIFILFIFVQINTKSASAQLKTKIMDIGNIIFNISEIKDFINVNFKTTTFNREELIANSHSLCISEFNMELNDRNKIYSLYGLPIIDLYAYRETADNVCLYVLMDLNSKKLFMLKDHIGYPENVMPEDFASGDFDFLYWYKSDINLVIMKDRFQNVGLDDNVRVVVSVTNIKHTFLADTRYLFGLK